MLLCTTKIAETTERRAQIQTALNALADECGSEYPADFESRMLRIVEKTKDGKEHSGLHSILYAVTNLCATAQEIRMMLNIWSDELTDYSDATICKSAKNSIVNDSLFERTHVQNCSIHNGSLMP